MSEAVASNAGRGPYRNGLRTREQILETALESFATTGFRGTSLREIASSVGLSAPTLLAHFGSKDRLLLAVLESWSDQTNTLEPARGPGLSWFAHYPNLMGFHMAHPGLLRLFVTLCAESIDPEHPAHAWIVARYQRLHTEGIENLRVAIANGEIARMTPRRQEAEIRALYAVMDGYALRWLNQPTFDLRADYQFEFDNTMRRWRRPEIQDASLPSR